ncbi:hypothetical protein RCL1_000437 [Eukaryota sp. TZLM3-RCL]
MLGTTSINFRFLTYVFLMRAVVQRVKSSSVSLSDGTVSGEIGPGLNVLLGISRDDSSEDADYIIRKLLSVRLWPDPESGKPWVKSAQQLGYGYLLVSQFTLFAVTSKGAKPDFHRALGPVEASQLFDYTVEKLRQQYLPELVQTGSFGAMMDVSIQNDGPVTVIIDSKNKDL